MRGCWSPLELVEFIPKYSSTRHRFKDHGSFFKDLVLLFYALNLYCWNDISLILTDGIIPIGTCTIYNTTKCFLAYDLPSQCKILDVSDIHSWRHYFCNKLILKLFFRNIIEQINLFLVKIYIYLYVFLQSHLERISKILNL